MRSSTGNQSHGTAGEGGKGERFDRTAEPGGQFYFRFHASELSELQEHPFLRGPKAEIRRQALLSFSALPSLRAAPSRAHGPSTRLPTSPKEPPPHCTAPAPSPSSSPQPRASAGLSLSLLAAPAPSGPVPPSSRKAAPLHPPGLPPPRLRPATCARCRHRPGRPGSAASSARRRPLPPLEVPSLRSPHAAPPRSLPGRPSRRLTESAARNELAPRSSRHPDEKERAARPSRAAAEISDGSANRASRETGVRRRGGQPRAGSCGRAAPLGLPGGAEAEVAAGGGERHGDALRYRVTSRRGAAVCVSAALRHDEGPCGRVLQFAGGRGGGAASTSASSFCCERERLAKFICIRPSLRTSDLWSGLVLAIRQP